MKPWFVVWEDVDGKRHARKIIATEIIQTAAEPRFARHVDVLCADDESDAIRRSVEAERERKGNRTVDPGDRVGGEE